MRLGSLFGRGSDRTEDADAGLIEPYGRTHAAYPPLPPEGGGADPLLLPDPRPRPNWWRWTLRGVGVVIILLVLAALWLAITAPLSQSLKPLAPPQITLLASDGKTPIARQGAVIGAPVDVTKLPRHVPEAFMAIEDRRFYSHWGVDPWGIGRAMAHNAMAGRMREGGSTITQQLAKNAFLDSDRTAGRKLREAMIAVWLEVWLTKQEILSRYLSNVYFGDNVYGLDAAARHYFSRPPSQLTVAQAAMLAGLVKAPSRLAPTVNLKGAQARQKLVVASMKRADFLTEAEAEAVRPATLRVAGARNSLNGSYFGDWVMPEARDRSGEIANEVTVTTTLDLKMQRAAEAAVRRSGLRQAQVALVAMRPDGQVVAMVGGKKYADSPFNRATQARRQPGSTFKLFVYLAALRSGLNPDSTVKDEPVTIANWSPKNSDGRYEGDITLARAFAKSSNVASARLIQQVGVKNVIRAARDLGVSTPIAEEASIALGTSTMSLLELTGAYAAIAAGSYPVRPRGLADEREMSWFERMRSSATVMNERERDGMRELLQGSISAGTGRQAALSVQAYGKTGTTQDARDALFVGYANGLVCGVWVGNDDNTPNPGLSGGGIPARLWRDFMQGALDIAPPPVPVEEPEDDPIGNMMDEIGGDAVLTNGAIFQGQLDSLGVNLRIGSDGSVDVRPTPGRERAPTPPARDARRAPPEDEGDGDQQD